LNSIEVTETETLSPWSGRFQTVKRSWRKLTTAMQMKRTSDYALSDYDDVGSPVALSSRRAFQYQGRLARAQKKTNSGASSYLRNVTSADSSSRLLFS